ncbi:hypothetical protein GWI33_002061 [Rhynchophorus ferrugineus]|uniref:Uncharacterized protein n=1 Tax=Rhynchophorus ferrugineus TaxID=354439 RepID=A0A834IXF3_RHYFE|nr:hypothetical protein GWI33_002061 [Rhynchophorus ferrugineus]
MNRYHRRINSDASEHFTASPVHNKRESPGDTRNPDAIARQPYPAVWLRAGADLSPGFKRNKEDFLVESPDRGLS